jgi:glycosyltransferase involved in cell wall biosynthesis
VYPPVDTERWTPDGRAPDDFLLTVARLVPYKRVDLAVQAASRLGRRLVVVGDGPERRRLEAMAGPGTRFLGWQSDEVVAGLYARARAFLFPGADDFGIAPVESQAAGRPVVAYGRGGALETVVHGVTGLHFAEQTVDSMAEAIESVCARDWDPDVCRAQAERFGAERFRTQIVEVVRVAHHGRSVTSPENARLAASGSPAPSDGRQPAAA